MPTIISLLLCVQLLVMTVTAPSLAAETNENSARQTIIDPKKAPGKETPLVVIYTLSTCSHCREAKQYLTSNNIPFINREIDSDDEHMEALIKVYDSMGVPEQQRGVPLFVIGDRIRIQGFNKDKLQSALKEVTSNPK